MGVLFGFGAEEALDLGHSTCDRAIPPGCTLIPSAASQSHLQDRTPLHQTASHTLQDCTLLQQPASQSDPTGLQQQTVRPYRTARSFGSQPVRPTGLHAPSAATVRPYRTARSFSSQPVRPYRTASADSQTLQDCISRQSDPTGLHQQTFRPYRTARTFTGQSVTPYRTARSFSRQSEPYRTARSFRRQTVTPYRTELPQQSASHTLKDRISSYPVTPYRTARSFRRHSIQDRISSQPITPYRTASAVSQSHPTGPHQQSASHTLQDCTLLQQTASHTLQDCTLFQRMRRLVSPWN